MEWPEFRFLAGAVLKEDWMFGLWFEAMNGHAVQPCAKTMAAENE